MSINTAALPSGWAWASVEDLGEIGEQTVLTGPFGTNLTKDDFVSSGVPVLTIGCLTDHGLELNKAMFVREKTAHELERYRLREGDFLFSRMASVGRASIVSASHQGSLFNYHIMRLRLSRKAYEPSLFLAYVRGADAAKAYIKTVNHGGTRDGINTEQLLKMPIAVPPFAEQHRIVSKLESLLARSRRTKEALGAIPALLEKFRQSVLAAAFRGDLTADWRAQNPDVEPASKLLEHIRVERRRRWEESELEKMHAKGKLPTSSAWKSKYEDPLPIDTSNLPALPPSWCWTQLDLVAEMALGKMLDRAKRTAGTSHPYIRNLNVRWGSMELADLATMPFEEHELERFGLREGDVLVCEGGEPGRATVWSGEPRGIKFQKAIHRLRTSTGLNPWWVVYHLWNDAISGNLETHFTGTTIKHFTGVALGRYPIRMVPPAEQREIIRRIKAAFQSIEALLKLTKAGLQNVAEFEQVIMNQAFRGELVPQDPNDEPASVLLERIRAEREAATGSAPKRSRGRSSAA